MEYCIVQAGGKGTRLGYLTANKPKGLVPIDNLPMMFHLFRKFPDKKFIVIADYHKDVMHEYLSAFADVKYQIVDAIGTKTCSGIRQAIDLIPENKSFMLTWSDLVLSEDFELPKEYQTDEIPINDYIGISKTFECRWSYKNNIFVEEHSFDHGVAGFFLFTDKSKLREVPESGEIVRWMGTNNMKFSEISLAGTKEFGLIEEYEKLEVKKCRPFNKITIQDDILIKEAIDKQGEALAVKERNWYKKASKNQIDILPKIYDYNPLKIEYIKGKNVYECDLDFSEKKAILTKIVNELKKLHSSEETVADSFSMKEAYFNKTIERLSKIEYLVPFAREKEITINGKKCRNVFYYKRELEKKLEELKCDKFAFIHGDCTFSNIMLREDGSPVLIDPRGYFGYTEIFGDARYDFSKLYYSVIGNYDRFNLGKFKLDISEKEVNLQIESNNWEDMEDVFFELTGMSKEEIKLIHAVIWLSLTTYAWQNYDSICGAFYNGLYYLEDIL